MEVKVLQEALANQARASYKKDSPLSERVIEAFFAVPRHNFVQRFRNYGDNSWLEFRDDNANQYLPVIYQDKPIVIWGSDEEFESKKGQKQVSTISQPSFVLRMLDLLDIRDGQTVFELGTASGWNAALISRLVGPAGNVITAEIIPELAEQANLRLKRQGYKNIRVISGDGSAGAATLAFDRVMFTAGAFDFPIALFEQTKLGGLVLFVLKNKGGLDNLYLLKRHEDYFESIYSQPCGFVPVTGKAYIEEMEEKDLSEFLSSHGISKSPTATSAFWWGSGNKDSFGWQTASLRGFLSLFGKFEAFQLAERKDAFGWYEPNSNSLAVAKAGELVSYGGMAARTELLERLKSWIDLGMPALGIMNLKIYRSEGYIERLPTSWVSRRPQATFAWSLPGVSE